MRTAIATILLLGVLHGSAAAFDRFVNPRGTCGTGTVGNKPQHATIQDAVDASVPGDEIGVCPDEYLEGATIPASKTGISLTAIGIVLLRAISIPSFSGFLVEADDVTIQRFEIRGFDTAAIEATGNRVTIQNNNIHHNDVGIALTGDGHRARNNVIDASFQFGIFAADVNGVEIAGNQIKGGQTGIIAFRVDQASPGTVFHHNVVIGTIVGIGVAEAAGGFIRNNTIRFNGQGIALIDTADVRILQNLVNKNLGTGIHVIGSTGCGIGLNSVTFNGLTTAANGIQLEGVDGCIVVRNNVSRNSAVDCSWDGAGANTFSANACASEDPAGAWD